MKILAMLDSAHKYDELKSILGENTEIVDAYNMETIDIEKYFKELTKLLEDLKEEEKRHTQRISCHGCLRYERH